MDSANIRMIQRGGGPGFAEEPLSGVRIVDRFRVQHFDRDFAFEFGVKRQENFAHATRAQLFDDPVVRNLFGSQVGLPRDGERIREGAIHSRGLFENTRVNLIPLPLRPNDELSTLKHDQCQRMFSGRIFLYFALRLLEGAVPKKRTAIG